MCKAVLIITHQPKIYLTCQCVIHNIVLAYVPNNFLVTRKTGTLAYRCLCHHIVGWIAPLQKCKLFEYIFSIDCYELSPQVQI